MELNQSQLELLKEHKNLKQLLKNTNAELLNLEQDYTKELLLKMDDIISLFNQIQTVDTTLQKMETDLKDYKECVATMNQEIHTLYTSSQDIDTKLQNRLKSHTLLSELLDGVIISPDLITKICQGEVNEFFISHIQELNHKMDFYIKNQDKGVCAFQTTGPELERLRIKAVDKIREFLLKKIESLKAPNTNIALIQQNVFLKYKELFWFLMERHEVVGVEIHENYIVTVSTYFMSSFEKYIKLLQKFQNGQVEKADVIAGDQFQKQAGIFSKPIVRDTSHIFGLGERIHILTSSDSGIIVPHHAEEQQQRFLFESIFKSLCRLLIDNASSEYVFTCEFFNKNGTQPLDSLQTFFNAVFDSTLKLVQNTIKQYVDSTFDAIGILLCIRLNQQHIRIMQKRLLPHLDSFLQGLNLLLWPKFQSIMGLHIDSLKKLDVKKVFNKDPNIHFITRRYAEFLCSILVLNQGFDDGLLLHSLSRLKSEYEGFLTHLSMEFPDAKLGFVSWINNIDCILSTLHSYAGSAFETEKQYFEHVLETKTLEYVKMVLKQFVPNLTMVVDRLERGENIPDDVLERTSLEFSQNWKQWLSLIYETITNSFSNFQIGAKVVQQCMTHFVLVYKVFLGVWEQRLKGKGKSGIVGIQSILVEIKKFKSNLV